MIKRILKLFGKAGKTVVDGVNKSTEFIDDTLEKEYITSSIDKAKEFTGKVAEKAGEVYEKTKDSAEEFMESDKIKDVTDRAKYIADTVVDKAKDVVQDVSHQGKVIVDKAMENETVSKVVGEVKEASENIGKKIKDTTDSVFGEEE